jgi:DGQHR domain-containing protein
MPAQTHRFSVSTVTQGNRKFYTCTIPSDILSRCCFVTTREEDPKAGFQRLLDKKRAEEIAHYIDHGLGTIPSSIILSAQKEAKLKIVGKGKTMEFSETPHAFMILDGQHRVYGFSLAQSHLRVPVVIYNDLSRTEETRLFIDINSKQKGVSNELLLDIKQLAEYENNDEAIMREVFDLFSSENNSAFLGRFSASSSAKGKISRVTFNGALKPILAIFRGKETDDIYDMLNNYFSAFLKGLESLQLGETVYNAIVFKAVTGLFPSVASKAKDRFGPVYSVDNFYEVMEGMFTKIKPSKLSSPGTSYKALLDNFEQNIRSEFTL